MYYFLVLLTALHVSGDIIARHQENLNSSDNFWFYSRVSLLSAEDNDSREAVTIV